MQTLIKLNPKTEEIEIDLSQTVDLISSGIGNLVGPTLETIKLNSELKRYGKILQNLNLDKNSVDWKKVNEIDLLQILQASSPVDPYANPEEFENWKSLIKSFFNQKEEFFKIRTWTTMLKSIDIEEYNLLKDIIKKEYHLKTSPLDSTEKNYRLIENLAKKEFLSVENRFGGRPAIGNIPMKDTGVFHFGYNNEWIVRIRLETREFIDFIEKNKI
jgi:hypothetical protein